VKEKIGAGNHAIIMSPPLVLGASLLFLVAALPLSSGFCFQGSHAFLVPTGSSHRLCALPRRSAVFLLRAEKNEGDSLPSMNFNLDDDDDEKDDGATEENTSLSYDEAQDAIAAENEEKEEALAEGVGLSQRERDNFYARQDTFDAMRARVDARATELGIEKSAATEQYIKEQIERREQRRQTESTSSGLDLSKIVKVGEAERNKAKEEDPDLGPLKFLATDETYGLSEEDMEASDPLYGKNIPTALVEETQLIEWPTPGQVLRQAATSAIGCVVFCYVLVQADKTIEKLLTLVGLYPGE